MRAIGVPGRSPERRVRRRNAPATSGYGACEDYCSMQKPPMCLPVENSPGALHDTCVRKHDRIVMRNVSGPMCHLRELKGAAGRISTGRCVIGCVVLRASASMGFADFHQPAGLCLTRCWRTAMLRPSQDAPILVCRRRSSAPSFFYLGLYTAEAWLDVRRYHGANRAGRI